MSAPDDAAASRAPEWLAASPDPLSQGFATVLTVIRPDVAASLATAVLEHVRYHSAYRPVPSGYQFTLPNGALLTVYDDLIGGRRRLGFMAPRGPGKVFMVIAARAWPRGVPQQGPWFAWPLSERKRRRLHRDVAHAVQVAYANRSVERRPRTVLIDPGTPPVRIDGQ